MSGLEDMQGGPNPRARVQKEKLGDQIYGIIREMIANFRFEPGKRLNVEQLSRELATSRTPVWEAIARLEQEGLVHSIPNRGVFIPELGPDEAQALYQVRAVLEGLAANLTATRISEERLTEMRVLLAENRAMLEAEDTEAFNRMDYKFHAVVFDTCGNPFLQETLQTIKIKMGMIHLDFSPVFDDIYRHHAALVDALERRSPAEAEAIMLEHNAFLRNYCIKLAEEKKNEDGSEA